ncbi:Uncharacterised protein [Chlamydia abortus]|nr:Uncharacterised protein [Chlamydia abortus]
MCFRICSEVARKIPAVEIHTFNNIENSFETFSFLNSNRAVFPHFFHGFGDEITNFSIIVSRNRRYLSDFFVMLYRFTNFFDLIYNDFDSFINTSFEVHRIGACSHISQSFTVDSFSKNSSCGSSVTSFICSFASNFFHHLSSHVLVFVFELNFFSDSYTVFCNLRRTEAFIDNHMTSFRT